jgi:hypothetical protein
VKHRETIDALSRLAQEDGSIWAYDASFPTVVDIDDARMYEEARIMVVSSPDDTTQLLVWAATPDGIQLVMDEPVSSMNSLVGLRRIRLTDGRIVTIHPTSGCGCGNPLKSWSPARVAGRPVARVAMGK